MNTRYIKIFAVLASLVVLGYGVFSPKKAPRAGATGTDPHYTAAQSWLKDARDVANKTQDEEAKKIADFLERSTGIGVARGNSITPIFLQPNDGTKVLLLPILNSDANDGDGLAEISSSRSFMAMFVQEHELILLRPVPVSDVWKGIILLHEGRHALNFAAVQGSRVNQESMAAEERDTHEFQNRITAKLGGERYAQVLQEEITRQHSYTGSTRFPLGTEFADIGRYQPGLDEAFGPAKSDDERASRETQVWTHAIFMLVDEDSRIADKESYKAALLLLVYKAQGMIP